MKLYCKQATREKRNVCYSYWWNHEYIIGRGEGNSKESPIGRGAKTRRPLQAPGEEIPVRRENPGEGDALLDRKNMQMKPPLIAKPKVICLSIHAKEKAPQWSSRGRRKSFGEGPFPQKSPARTDKGMIFKKNPGKIRTKCKSAHPSGIAPETPRAALIAQRAGES